MNRNERNFEIDGIRGWAAFIVLIFHFFKETFGRYYPVFNHNVFGVFFDGQLMVFIFFVLSGDALSISFFRSMSADNTHRIVVARYFRLTFPILITCFLSYICLKLNLTYNTEASVIVNREDWLGIFLNFDESFMGFLRYSLEGVYMHHDVYSSYNPFLWTMSVEILGSIIVFLNVFVLGKIKQEIRLWVLILQTLFFLFFSEFLALFVFGMILGYLRSQGVFKKFGDLKYNYLFLLIFALLVFLIMPFERERIYHYIDLITLKKFTHLSYTFVYAGLIVFLIYSSNRLKSLFSGRVSLFLGEISFPIYILQFNVLVTLSSWMIIWFNTLNILDTWMFLLIPIISIFCTILLALCFRFLEKSFLNKMNNIIKNKILM